MSQREYERKRKAAWRAANRERLKQEAAANRERERVRELPDDARCHCCGEDRAIFLASATRCWNCAHADLIGPCPHQGHGILG